jgi:hypothetical protein
VVFRIQDELFPDSKLNFMLLGPHGCLMVAGHALIVCFAHMDLMLDLAEKTG